MQRPHLSPILDGLIVTFNVPYDSNRGESCLWPTFTDIDRDGANGRRPRISLGPLSHA